jgi:hypothetical protein
MALVVSFCSCLRSRERSGGAGGRSIQGTIRGRRVRRQRAHGFV